MSDKTGLDLDAEHAAAEQAGFHAAHAGVQADKCPYAFSRVNVAQDVFEALYHPLLDAWMEGWNRWHTENDRKPWIIKNAQKEQQ